MSEPLYSAKSVFDGLNKTLQQYLEAQYHVWDESIIAERKRLLDAPGVCFQPPFLESTPSYTAGAAVSELQIPEAARAFLKLASGADGTGIPPTPYFHQAQALEAFLGKGEDILVATGTGSGKTESFLMPILGALAVESRERAESWGRSGMRALLLYPMNALVNDQLSRLRRVLGNSEVFNALRIGRGHGARFGMYTSRTPYPGWSTVAKDKKRVGDLLKKHFIDLPEEARNRLAREGKWPAKDLAQFIETFETGANDAELLTRREMQVSCPDILVTNYSMLEYMLLRPIEQEIFGQTADWLRSDKANSLIVVLDEAHMYRGASGAEVAYLLRRLHSRLGVSRERVRYVLTSASLGSTEEARQRIVTFAANLTGKPSKAKPFSVITGKIDDKPNARVASQVECDALAAFDFSTLHRAYESLDAARTEIASLSNSLRITLISASDLSELQSAVYRLLTSFGPASLAANLITSSPMTLDHLASAVFPHLAGASRALESLLALMSFGREERTNRVFCPVRSHLFFRGLPGLFVCINPSCPERIDANASTVVGRAYARPRLRCACGGRVYELFTHRDCGAAYIRGYLTDSGGDFLWHERSAGLWSEALLEAHFLVEATRLFPSPRSEGVDAWLHVRTGQLRSSPPHEDELHNYLRLIRPNGLVQDEYEVRLSFNRACPVCINRWQGRSKIMDLATKGEAPFAHLIRTQVALQPRTQTPTDQSPNGGRKSLLFSDGRQKAARLARDIPREIEQDVFRQLVLLAAEALRNHGHEALLGHWIFAAFIHVLSRTGLQMFDGEDHAALQRAVTAHRNWNDSDLEEALRQPSTPPPGRFSSLLLRQLGSRFYSVSALTLGFLAPSAKALGAVARKHPDVSRDDLVAVLITFVQRFADTFSLDTSIRQGVRYQAAGYPVTPGLARDAIFTAEQRAFLSSHIADLNTVLEEAAESMCERDTAGLLFLSPGRIRLEIGTSRNWFQCGTCTAVSPVQWWGHCPNCLTGGIKEISADSSSYLRARKGFWRDPTIRVLSGAESPLNLTVEEHTAQLSYRDVDNPASTTEEFERRFRDILVKPTDASIDVLSSTTTMEVGIDIGSLVAVGLRNVPPMRQNYQQRAGRAGRRGSAVSTVITYAQNSPHDNSYFENPRPIIAGEPVLPAVDTENEKIIERHIRAQIVQEFFHSQAPAPSSGDIFSMLGDTWDFYAGDGRFSLNALSQWIESPASSPCYDRIKAWLPEEFSSGPKEVARQFLTDLARCRPAQQEELEQSDQALIEFLFSHGFLPSYAFPRDLCALQIESRGNNGRTQIIQRPQQGLNVALSEYAPGRLVVVDKKTYRIGTVAASGSSVVVDRAERLFAGQRTYVHCPACLFTAGFSEGDRPTQIRCPLCEAADLRAVTVIQPEVVYPDDGKEVDEFDDEQVFTQATDAQLPLPEGGATFDWQAFKSKGRLAFARDQSLVMVNKGTPQAEDTDGFLVCRKCGKTSASGQAGGPHKRDYQIDARAGVPRPPFQCSGDFERVYLGYSFSSDILLFEIPIESPLRFDPQSRRDTKPLSDALQSLCEGLVIAVSRVLDIDMREMSAGYRFVRSREQFVAHLFLYDTLSGGAGYATHAGEQFDTIFDELGRLLLGCDCTSSCDKCLRHYGNRFHHEDLDRFLALDLMNFVDSGRLPRQFERNEQRRELQPLREMLELAGWSVSEGVARAFMAKKGHESINLACFPSLLDASALGFAESSSNKSFSPYELSRDLPGAFGSLV
jgi:ATP-dependent helicase YprA (DUF1998 family)